MAILALKSVQETEGVRKRPTEDHGKLRFQYFNLAAVAVAGDAGTTIDLCELPPGAVRVLPWLSRLSVSALGSSRTLNLGHRAYQKSDPDAAYEAENGTAFISALDVSSAVANVAWSSTVQKYDMFSQAGIMLFAQVNGGTLPVAATMSGFAAYLYE